MEQNNSPWTCDNSALFVVACMRLLMRVCPDAITRGGYVNGAHQEAKAVPTENQEAYDFVFCQSLLKALQDNGVASKEDVDHWALWHLVDQSPQSVATEEQTACTQPQMPFFNLLPIPVIKVDEKDPNDMSKWTVEQWIESGLSFQASAARIDEDGIPTVTLPFGKSRKGLIAGRLEQMAEDFADSFPWGRGAVPVAKWAWEAAGLEGKPNITRQIEISRILTVLYHAGVISHGALVPVGMGHKAHVRPPGRGRPKGSKNKRRLK